MYEYFEKTNFFEFYTQMLINFSQNDIESKIDQLDKQGSIIDLSQIRKIPHGGTKNPFLNIYHSFFNVKLLMRSHKQPEDFGSVKTNIDAIDMDVFNRRKTHASINSQKRFSKDFPSIVDVDESSLNSKDEVSVLNQGKNTPLIAYNNNNSQFKNVQSQNVVGTGLRGNVNKQTSLGIKATQSIINPFRVDQNNTNSVRSFNKIDSMTENFTNPMASHIINPKIMNANFQKIEKYPNLEKGNSHIAS